MSVTIQMLTWFQVISLKNLYDQEIWPNKIGIIHETGELIIEYEHTAIGSNGFTTQLETIKIPKEHTL